MERLIDRIVIFLLTVFVGRSIMTDRYLIVVLYSVISIALFDFFLLFKAKVKSSMKMENLSEKAAFALEIVAVAASLVDNRLIILVPIALYGAVIIRNYVALALAVISGLSYITSGEDYNTILYVELLIVVSIYLSFKCSRTEIFENDVKRLRDESVIREEDLLRNNVSLIKAKDDEIYLSTLKERNRIAREIHDNVGHMLTRAILQLGALITICKDETLKGGLVGLKETLDTAMNNIRNSVHDLRDEAIDVPTAINDIVAPLREDRKLTLEVDISSDIDKSVKYAIIGVVKEGVSNIIKHSDNEYVDITLNEHPVMYQLVIHDYSEHADEIKANADLSGMGLDNIRARVENVGGNVLITDDNGFRIFVTIPK